MRMLLVLALFGVAAAGRLENTYLPPENAVLAGGQDLALPSRTYLPAHTEAVQKSFTAAYQPQPQKTSFTASRTTFSSQAPVNNYLPPTQTSSFTAQRVSSPVNTYLPPATAQEISSPGNTYLPPQQESNSLVVEAPIQRQQFAPSHVSHPNAFSFSHSSTPFVAKTSTYGISQPSAAFVAKPSSFGFSQQSYSAIKPYSALSSTKTASHGFSQQPSSFLSKTSSHSFAQQASPFFTKSSSSGYSGFSQQIKPFAAKTATSSVSQQGSYSYPQPSTPFAAQQSSFSSQHSGGYASSEASIRQGFSSAPVAIIRSLNENNGDGVYRYNYETENGIQAEEQGQLRQDGAEGIETVQGAYSYTGPDNVRYTVTYTADENGFQASGEHLPTPPPIPEAILRSLEQNAREEAEALRSASYQGQQGYQYNQPKPDGGYHY